MSLKESIRWRRRQTIDISLPDNDVDPIFQNSVYFLGNCAALPVLACLDLCLY